MTTVNPFLFSKSRISKTKTASVCAPTDPVFLVSPTKRQGWNAGGRTVPEGMFGFSKKMPAIGLDVNHQPAPPKNKSYSRNQSLGSLSPPTPFCSFVHLRCQPRVVGRPVVPCLREGPPFTTAALLGLIFFNKKKTKKRYRPSG